MRRSAAHRPSLTRIEPRGDTGPDAGAYADSSTAPLAITDDFTEAITQALARADAGCACGDRQVLWGTGDGHGGRRPILPI